MRNPETSLEINRRLSRSGNSRERGADHGVARRRFQELEHSRPELTGKRNVVRVWTRDTGREIDRRDHGRDDRGRDRRDDVRIDRRPFDVAQREHGPISPSEWEAHRQSRIDARRGEGPSIDPRSPRQRHDRSDFHDDRQFDRHFDRRFDTNQPESYDFRYRSRSPIGPAEIGRGFIIQYDTRPVTSLHQHHPGCGHFRFDDDWHLFPEGHKHHAGCGHHFFDNQWHLWSPGHEHFPGCGHFFHEGAWFDFPRDHVHGPNCGHFRFNEVWHWFPEDHVHGPNCGHFNWNETWHFWPKTHRHHPGCGHYFYNSLWYPYLPSHYGYEPEGEVYGDDEEDFSSELVDAYDGDARRHAERAYERSREGDSYGAIAAFSTAIAMASENGPLYLAQGLVYMQVGDLRSAYNKIEQGLSRMSDLSEGHPNLMALFADPNLVRWHISDLTALTEQYPNEYRAQFMLGYLHFLQGEYEKAKGPLQEAAARDSGNPQVRRLLDHIYQLQTGGNS